MDRYYYTACQLPLLFFGEETFITRENLLIEAKKWLSSRDYSVLSNIDINDYTIKKTDIQIVKDYKKFERQLREDLAAWRRSLKEGTPVKNLGFPLQLVKEGNPLEIEKKLMQLRWDFIEKQEWGHYFDIEFLVLFVLKIQLLERFFKFNKKIGKERFNQLCEV